MLAAGISSCVEFEEIVTEKYIPKPGETIHLSLNADRGESDVDQDTRVYVGQIVGNKVKYYWNEGDQIGVIPFFTFDKNSKPNYVTSELEIYSDNQNLARFGAYITANGYNTDTPDLLIYYPYNSSMLEGLSGLTSGVEYAGKGLTFRLPQEQEQYGYGKTFVGENDDVSKEHPSVWAISNYGLAYDLATTQISSESIEGVTTAKATGEFVLDHANTYLQFNVYGTQADGSENDYGNGTWKVSEITVEAGEYSGGEFSGQVDIAGTYQFKYDYDEAHFTNVSGDNNNGLIKLTNKIGAKSVKVSMKNMANAPFLGSSIGAAIPAFVVINGLSIKESVNCLKASVTAYQYDENGRVIGSDTRIRYYNITDIVGKDISGNYYTIPFEFCDPVELYTDLSLTNTANTYLIGAPGNYRFAANVAGNAELPHGFKEGETVMGIDPKNLMPSSESDPKYYALDWLWASGTSFDKIPYTNDTEVVKTIINRVGLDGNTGEISISLAAGSTENLSGNVVLALYETNDNGTLIGDIIWTWHIWLSQPEIQHFRFQSTNRNYTFSNEDWYMMDRNLGAESNELGNPRSAGLYYQSGRKEPLIGYNNVQDGKSWTSNMLKTYRNDKFGEISRWKAGVAYNNYNTLKNPMWLIEDIPYSSTGTTNDYYYAWTASDGAEEENDISNDTKSMFDPCPVGYRLPTTREWDNFKADLYVWISGVQNSGVFGYCKWYDLYSELLNSSDERAIDYVSRIANGDYYVVNDQYERTYYITKNSGTGSQITTTFPNTGVLHADGTWNYLYQNETKSPVTKVRHGDGPNVTAMITRTNESSGVSISAPQIPSTPSYSSSRYNLTSITGTYYYSVGVDNPATTLSASQTPRIYRTGNGTTSGRNIYLGLSNSKTTETVYFYYKDSNGNVSNPTTVTVTRRSSTNYTITYINGEAKSGTTYTLNLAFDDGVGTYYYAVSSNGAKKSFTGSTLSIDCNDITFVNEIGTVYLYTLTDEVYSAPSMVKINKVGGTFQIGQITKGRAYDEITGGGTISNVTSEATMVLWSSGRVNEGTYHTYWFGPGANEPDGWGIKTNEGWGHNGNTSTAAPFTESRETYTINYGPYGPTGYNNYKANDPAAPMRCIREYDNASTSTVNE